MPRNRREKVPHNKQIKLVIVCLNLPTYTSNNSMRVIIIPPVDMLPKGMLTYSYNTCQLVPSSMLTCMSPTTCMSTLLHMSTYSLTMLTCSIKYVNMCKQVCQHAFHSQHACQEFSTCQHTAPRRGCYQDESTQLASPRATHDARTEHSVPNKVCGTECKCVSGQQALSAECM